MKNRRSTKDSPTKAKTLTYKQAKLIEGIAAGKSSTQAAIDAGYSERSAHVLGPRTMQRLALKAPEVLDRAGLTLDVLVRKRLKPLLEAKETKFFAHEGRVMESRDVVAWEPRRAGLEMAFRMHGAYPKNGDGNHVSVSGPVFVMAIADAGRAQKLLDSMAVRRSGGEPTGVDDAVHRDAG